ncbi:glycosyl hydrolase [uncultured Shewanella sp.]|uniref:glycoside hydrolase family 26 protein n=1 Tax=uncultured Shewanella sp. TaxID=173975 RepID=UPI00262D5A3F|nr:glycosyl hydrolase [uncultured Shewanella sp.]
MRNFTCLVSSIGLTSIVGLASANKLMLGAYIRDDAYKPENITEFESDINKDIAIINIFTNFDYDWHTLRVQNTNIVAQGATPMITLEPTIAARPEDNLLPEIIAGDWDAYLEQWIADFRIWIEDRDDPNARIQLRFAHEFNGNWYPWSNDPEQYIPAWRHLHAKFEAAGVNQYVEWVWNVNNVDVDDYGDITLYYPGRDVVDWTSIDGYNWGANYSFSQWNTFTELFEEKYDLLMLHYPHHPILIAEVGSAEPSDIPEPHRGQDGDNSDRHESKSRWITDMFTQLRTKFQGIKGIIWFNINKELSWSLNETEQNTGLEQFKKMAQNKDITSQFRPAEYYVNEMTQVEKSRSVQHQGDGFYQLPKTSIKLRRKPPQE